MAALVIFLFGTINALVIRRVEETTMKNKGECIKECWYDSNRRLRSVLPLKAGNHSPCVGTRHLKGQRSVANTDEDSLTTGVEAAVGCLRSLDRKGIKSCHDVFLSPVNSANTMIGYGTDAFQAKDMFRIGVPVFIATFALLVFRVLFYRPLVDLK